MRPLLVSVLVLISLRGWGQQIEWEALERHPFSTTSGPQSNDQMMSIASFDSTLITLGKAQDEDSSGVLRNYNYLYSYTTDGRKLWEWRWPEYAVRNMHIARVTDTSWALSCEYSYSNVPPGGRQNGGVCLRVFNLSGIELWRWKFYENSPYSCKEGFLPNLLGGKILYSLYRYDTGFRQNIGEIRTFTPEGFLVKIDTVSPIGSLPFLIPLAGGGWLKGTGEVTSLGARYHVQHLDSAFHVVRDDTMARRGAFGSAGVEHLACPDGGYLFFNRGIRSVPGVDSTWLRVERHDAQGGLMWEQTRPRNDLTSSMLVKGLADGGWLWIRYVNKKESEDSLRIYFERMNADGSVHWSVEMPTIASTGLLIGSTFTDIAFDGQGSGYVVGATRPEWAGENDSYAYVRKVANLGVPYDPLATRPHSSSSKNRFLAYPNPSAGPVTIHTRSRQPLAVYSLSGQKRLEVQADPSGTTVLDLSGLPMGMYELRQGENSVKLIKH